jgi:hypothetical protein
MVFKADNGKPPPSPDPLNYFKKITGETEHSQHVDRSKVQTYKLH